MKKSDFIKAITKTLNSNYTKSSYGKKVVFSMEDTKAYLNAIRDVVFATITEEEIPLMEGLVVASKVRDACVRRNPATGESINVPAKRVPVVKVRKPLRDACAFTEE